jgi:glucuronosyltransferase
LTYTHARELQLFAPYQLFSTQLNVLVMMMIRYLKPIKIQSHNQSVLVSQSKRHALAMKLSILLLTLIIANLSSASRILFLFPTPSKSHLVIVHALSTTLAEKGHDVTVFSPFPLSKQITGHREFLSPISAKNMKTIEEFASGTVTTIKIITTVPQLGTDLAQDMIATSDFQNILNEKFDLIIIGLTANNFLLGFGHHFNCPTAMLSVQRHSSYSNNLVGNPIEMNAVKQPVFQAANLNSFLHRVRNTLAFAAEKVAFAGLDYYEKSAYE